MGRRVKLEPLEPKTKVDVISDIHLDFYVKECNPGKRKTHQSIKRFVEKLIPEKQGDLLIIAGDISHYNNQIEILLGILKNYYKDVAFTFGNHEMYLISGSTRKKYNYLSSNRIDELQGISETTETYFLNGDSFKIGEITVGGNCGWYDLPHRSDIVDWKKFTNDSALIYSGYPITTMYGGTRNPVWDTQAFYEQELRKLENISSKGCNVLVNHVAQSIPPLFELPNIYRNDPSNKFYYTDNFKLIKQSGCSHYIFGHTHDKYDFIKDGIEMICNPYGYPHENTFVGVKQIDIF